MDPRLARFFDEVLEYLWEASPTMATSLGIHDHDHRLIECAPEAIAERGRRLSAYRFELQRLQGTPSDPTPDQELDARVLGSLLEVEGRLLDEVRPLFRDPGAYLEEILHGVYYLVQRDFAPLPERAHRVALRLREVPRLLRQGTANLADPGEVPPAWVEAALRQVRGSLTFLAGLERDLVPQAGAAGGDLGPALVEAMRAIDGFVADVGARIRGAARGDFAIGRPLFDFLLRAQHGLEFDSETLYAFGGELVARTQKHLEAAAREIDPRRAWQDLVTEWKSDHPAREDFLAGYRTEADRARGFVRRRDLVSFPPRDRLRVVETPPFQRGGCPFAAYVAPAPFEEGQEGLLWVTPPEEDAPRETQERHLQDHMRAGVPGTIVHETYPGHHLQLTIANRIDSRVRRSVSTPVLVEGWAFYCEQMMREEGYYEDPRSRVLQLKDELWRSCRVLIDVGLQTRGMNLDQAIGILHDTVRMEESSARGEVLRYCRMPTQPMSYATGKHEILKLRTEYRSRRGSSFLLREFHDRFLSFGSIPIALIRDGLLGAA